MAAVVLQTSNDLKPPISLYETYEYKLVTSIIQKNSEQIIIFTEFNFLTLKLISYTQMFCFFSVTQT